MRVAPDEPPEEFDAEVGRTASKTDAGSGLPLPAGFDELFAAPQRPRFRITLGAAVVLALVVAAVLVLAIALQPRSSGLSDASTVPPTALATTSAAAPTIDSTAEVGALVHVLGAVAEPGVYQLAPGARVVDAVTAAGGLAGDADAAAVNLARIAVDGEQIYVPRIGEEPRPAPESAGDAPGDGGGLINVNTASASELETLPRIGPAMSQRIIDYREANGPFASIDDLGEVPGIGDATLEGLRPLVTV